MSDRIIPLDDSTPETIPASTADEPLSFQSLYECPRCHSLTYGFFAPFAKKGVKAWCSVCNYATFDEEIHKAWLAEHPDDIEEDD